jgi:cation diffusion facilitator family transporter
VAEHQDTNDRPGDRPNGLPPAHDDHDHDHGHDDHGHGHDVDGHGHGHGHDDHDHDHRRGLRGRLREFFVPHSHDAAQSIDDALTSSRDGLRALKLSLGALAVTALLQAVLVAISSSVGLFADAIHNAADASTALPLAIALLMSRKAPTERYTYGFGRAEDLAGIFVVAIITASAVSALWVAVERLVHPRTLRDVGLVIVGGIIGFVGNEIAARYRITTGRRIGSAALIADGMHARADGATSLAVAGAGAAVLLGWRGADPVVGVLVSVVIVRVLLRAARDIYRRLMDAVDPALVEQVEEISMSVEGVAEVTSVRIRWIGHQLHAAIRLTVEPSLSVALAHDISEHVNHELLHGVSRLTEAIIHCDPAGSYESDPHERTAHHPAP